MHRIYSLLSISKASAYAFLLLAAGVAATTPQAQAQTLTCVQGFEGPVSNSDSELGYIGEPTFQTSTAASGWTNAGSPLCSNGLKSWGISNTTEGLLFRGRRLTAGTNNYIQFRLAAWGKTSSEGMEVNDNVQVNVSINNGPYTRAITITGRNGNEAAWGYSTTGSQTITYNAAVTNTVASPPNGNSAPNDLSTIRINLPADATTVQFNIIATNDNVNELWTIDQVTIGSNSPLPVELKSFTAEASAKGTQVRWSTASEKDNAGFEVQRGTSSDKFETIAHIAGHGTTTQAHSYEYLDAKPLAGLSYYRLRQTDLDGTETFSPVVAVKPVSVTKATFFPNPTTGSVVLATDLGAVRYRILNALGQAVQSGESNGGSIIDVQALRAGSYFLELQTASGRQIQRFVREM